MRGFDKSRLPRPGSRRRAVFDALLENAKAGKTTTWAQAKVAYDGSPPPLDGHSRRYSGMELARVLRHYAARVSRGLYAMKDKWKERALRFQPGDLVSYVGGYGYFEAAGVPVGATFEVAGWGRTRLGDSTEFVYLKDEDGHLPGYPKAKPGGHSPEHFELVKKEAAAPVPPAPVPPVPVPSYKAGDWAEVIDDCGGIILKNGDVHRVLESKIRDGTEFLAIDPGSNPRLRPEMLHYATRFRPAKPPKGLPEHTVIRKGEWLRVRDVQNVEEWLRPGEILQADRDSNESHALVFVRPGSGSLPNLSEKGANAFFKWRFERAEAPKAEAPKPEAFGPKAGPVDFALLPRENAKKLARRVLEAAGQLAVIRNGRLEDLFPDLGSLENELQDIHEEFKKLVG